MYRFCTTEKTAQQQRQFEKTFLKLMLEVSYDTITVSELCRRAGLSRKIYYRLFEQKVDVLYALVDHTFLDFEAYQPEDPANGDGIHRFLAFWKEQKPLLDVLAASQTSALLSERAVLHVMQEDSVTRRCFGADTTRYGRETLVFFITGLFSLVMDWHRYGYSKSIDEMAQLLLSLLTSPPIKEPLQEHS